MPFRRRRTQAAYLENEGGNIDWNISSHGVLTICNRNEIISQILLSSPNAEVISATKIEDISDRIQDITIPLDGFDVLNTSTRGRSRTTSQTIIVDNSQVPKSFLFHFWM